MLIKKNDYLSIYEVKLEKFIAIHTMVFNFKLILEEKNNIFFSRHWVQVSLNLLSLFFRGA